jgi:RNA polymerase sigma-70 factor (ECF subfamily)
VAAFVRAATGGEYQGMIDLLAEESTLIIDAGPNATKAVRIRNVGRPVYGAKRIASFLVAVAQQSTPRSTPIPHILNGQPAIVMMRDGRAVAAILVSVADGKIRHVFVHADAARLTRLGPLN